MAATTRTRPPSAADIAAAIAAASAAQEERGILKHAPGVIVAIILALILWVGSTLLSLNNTVTRMSANVDGLSKAIADLQLSQGASTKSIGEIQAQVAEQRARASAIESDANRIKERIRILEGQRPLSMDTNVPR